MAAALHRVTEDEDEAERDVEERCDVHVGACPWHHLLDGTGAGEEQCHHRTEEQEAEDGREDRVDDLDDDRGAHTRGDALTLSAAVVLAAVGRHRLAHGCHLLREDAVQLVGCGGCGDRCGAEEVDGGLHDDGAARGDGELKCHRDADGHLSLGVGGIDAPVDSLWPEHLLLLIDKEETEGGGDALREIRGESGTRDTEL